MLICTEEGNFHEYLKIADKKHSIFEMHLNGNRLEEKAGAIVRDAWMQVKDQVLKQNNAQYGAAGICNGGGGASAVVIESV